MVKLVTLVILIIQIGSVLIELINGYLIRYK
jgi:hypothetical protein